MRHVFLNKNTEKVKKVAQPLLGDHTVFVAVSYLFLNSREQIKQVIKAQEQLFENVPFKVKNLLGQTRVKTEQDKEEVQNGPVCRNSYSGYVIAVGKKVTKVRPGDLVAGTTIDQQSIDLICSPENLVTKLSKKEHLRDASIVGLGAIALQLVRRASLVLGEQVGIVGLGVIGQLVVQLGKLAGCFVTGIDQELTAVKQAKNFGADIVLHTTDNLKQEIAYLTEHHGLDVIMVTDPFTYQLIEQQVPHFIRKKGRIVFVENVDIQLIDNLLQKKEIDLLLTGSFGSDYDGLVCEEQGIDYPYAYVRWTEQRNMQMIIALIEQKKLNIIPLIKKEITVDTIDQIDEQLASKKEAGVIFCYQQDDYISFSEQPKVSERIDSAAAKIKDSIRFIPSTKDMLRIGLIGVGKFARNKLIPILVKKKDVRINAIVDVDSNQAERVSRLYGAAKACVYDDDLFQEDIVDVVMIASPHKYHASQVCKALEQGKAVFVEKPMVVNFEQLQQIRSLLQQKPSLPFCVDYNRSFAPFVKKIKKVIVQRCAPLMIHYRINAGRIPQAHWIQTDIGAGRVIGEACHIIDLFCFLTEAQPISVSVESLHASRDDIFPTDNFCAQIRFDDGSLCSLFYSALGHAQVSKEYMEIFFDSKTIIMDNYKSLHGFGLPPWFDEVASAADKGHKALIDAFFAALKQDIFVPPISFRRLDIVAYLTLIIDQLVCEGGGTREL